MSREFVRNFEPACFVASVYVVRCGAARVVIERPQRRHRHVSFRIEPGQAGSAGFAEYVGEVPGLGNLVARKPFFAFCESHTRHGRETVGGESCRAGLAAAGTMAVVYHFEWLENFELRASP